MKFINNFYNTALSIAIENGNIDIIKLLLNHKNIDNNIIMISTCIFIKFHLLLNTIYN